MPHIHFEKYTIRDCVYQVVDNRGKNPVAYFEHEQHPVIDNYLIQNTRYPDLTKVKRFINQQIFDTFLRGYLERDDLLMTLVGNGIGSVTLAPSPETVIIQNTIGLKTNEKLNCKSLNFT